MVRRLNMSGSLGECDSEVDRRLEKMHCICYWEQNTKQEYPQLCSTISAFKAKKQLYFSLTVYTRTLLSNKISHLFESIKNGKQIYP